MSYKILLLFSVYFLSQTYLFSQRSIRSGKDYAYFFFVSEFEDDNWTPLPETEREVVQIARELENNYGFDCEIIENPTKQQIIDKITAINKKNYRPKDQVLLFFSSHGVYDTLSNDGYLVPSDGKSLNDEYGDSKISYIELANRIIRSKCQHILLALDACYSGAFGLRTRSAPKQTPWAKEFALETRKKKQMHTLAKLEASALAVPSRLYFTSGSKDQRTPASSAFAKSWLELLQEGATHKIIRTQELLYYLRNTRDLSPQFDSFSKSQNIAEDFIFVHNSANRISQKKINDQKHWSSLEKNPDWEGLKNHVDVYGKCEHIGEILDLVFQLDTRSFDLTLTGLRRGFNISNQTTFNPSAFSTFSCTALKYVRSIALDPSIPTKLVIENKLPSPRKIYWLDFNGRKKEPHFLAPDSTLVIPTYAFHTFLITDEKDNCLFSITPKSSKTDTFTLANTKIQASGKTVGRVEFGNNSKRRGNLVQTSDTTWIGEGVERIRYKSKYHEIRRNKEGVYLRSSLGEYILIDLIKQKIYKSKEENFAIKESIFEILSATTSTKKNLKTE